MSFVLSPTHLVLVSDILVAPLAGKQQLLVCGYQAVVDEIDGSDRLSLAFAFPGDRAGADADGDGRGSSARVAMLTNCLSLLDDAANNFPRLAEVEQGRSWVELEHVRIHPSAASVAAAASEGDDEAEALLSLIRGTHYEDDEWQFAVGSIPASLAHDNCVLVGLVFPRPEIHLLYVPSTQFTVSGGDLQFLSSLHVFALETSPTSGYSPEEMETMLTIRSEEASTSGGGVSSRSTDSLATPRALRDLDDFVYLGGNEERPILVFGQGLAPPVEPISIADRLSDATAGELVVEPRSERRDVIRLKTFATPGIDDMYYPICGMDRKASLANSISSLRSAGDGDVSSSHDDLGNGDADAPSSPGSLRIDVAGPPASPQALVLHNGFVCSACGMDPIAGDRHRCRDCLNVDLCPSCFEVVAAHPQSVEGHENTHRFILIRKPLTGDQQKSAKASVKLDVAARSIESVLATMGYVIQTEVVDEEDMAVCKKTSELVRVIAAAAAAVVELVMGRDAEAAAGQSINLAHKVVELLTSSGRLPTTIRSDVGPHIQSVGEACLSLVRLPGVVARGTDQGNGTVLDETGGLRNLEDETNVVAHRLGNALVAVMNLCDGCLVDTLETSQ